MNPTIEELWKAAVMSVALGVMDGYELTEPGKEAARKRLEELGAPVWVIGLREYLLERLNTAHAPFLPAFLIRCEVCMAGIRCLYPVESDRLAVHGRVLTRFLLVALAPIAQQMEGSEDSQEYDSLLSLYQLFSSKTPLESEDWSEILDRLEQQVVSHQPRSRADYIAFWCVRLSRYGLFHPYEAMEEGLINRFMFQLIMEYQHCLGDDGYRADRITHVFLEALETQCPEPDWMPRA